MRPVMPIVSMPCANTDGLEPFMRMRAKMDGCLTGSRLAKDRAAEALTQVGRGVAVQAKDPGQRRRDLRALRAGSRGLAGKRRRVRHQPVPANRGRQGDGPAPVVDRAPGRGDLGAHRDLVAGLGNEPVVPGELPVAEAGRAGRPEDEEDREDEQRPPATVGPAQHASARRDDEWIHELPEAGVEGLLPDGRLATEAVEVGAQLVLLGQEDLAIREDAVDLDTVGGHADRLDQRDEAETEDQDDAGGRLPAHHLGNGLAIDQLCCHPFFLLSVKN